MTAKDLASWRKEFEAFHARFSSVFSREESRQHASEYMRGLMAPVERKNGWQIAEQAGHARPDRLQRLLHRSTWSADEARDVLLEFVAERFGISDGIGILDETGFLKKGQQSVGVQRQYSGTAGKIDNCQVAVFVGYLCGSNHLLVDRRLFLPQSWSEDAPRRQKAAVPESIAHRSKPELAAEMLEHCWQHGLPMRWVSGDEVYGNAQHLRRTISQHGKLYVLAVSSTTTGWTKRPPTIEPDAPSEGGQKRPSRRPRVRRRLAPEAEPPQTVRQLIAALPERKWQRLSLLRGEKGPRRYDWTARRFVTWSDGADGEELWLVARRSIDSPEEIAYYVSNAPRTTAIEEMARVAMQRYAIEQCFEEAKGELGLDHYEVRTWPSWHRHVTLTMMALAWLASLRASHQKTEPGVGRVDHRRDAPTTGSGTTTASAQRRASPGVVAVASLSATTCSAQSLQTPRCQL